jgi:hypothetical protein
MTNLTAFQKDAIEDASVTFEQIASTIDLMRECLDALREPHPIYANALGGAAAYARLQGERLDKLPTMEA